MIDGSNKGGTKPRETELEALRRSTSTTINEQAATIARLERENSLLARVNDAHRATRGNLAVTLHQTATGRPLHRTQLDGLDDLSGLDPERFGFTYGGRDPLTRDFTDEQDAAAIREAWTWLAILVSSCAALTIIGWAILRWMGLA